MRGSSNERCARDVLVIGCGPVGVAHAMAIRATGRSVALIGPLTARPAGTLELLSGRTAPTLRRLGVLSAVNARGTRCAGAVFRWGRDRFAEQSGRGGDWDGGWVIDRAWFDPLLRSAVEATDITVIADLATSVSRERGRWQVRCAAGRRHAGQAEPVLFDSAEVAIATGRTGRLTRGAGLTRNVRHKMVAITARAPQRIDGLGPRLLVDPAPNGWWFALGDGAVATVGYVTDADLLPPGANRLTATWRAAARRLDWLPADAVGAALQARSAVVAGAGDLVPQPGGVLALGDAALAADPLSGHGLVLGLDGAIHAVSDPVDYVRWLAAEQDVHQHQEVSLYGQERRWRHREFWSRRQAES